MHGLAVVGGGYSSQLPKLERLRDPARTLWVKRYVRVELPR